MGTPARKYRARRYLCQVRPNPAVQSNLLGTGNRLLAEASPYDAIWGVVPPEAIQYAVLLCRDSWMRFSERSYRTLPPRPSDNRVLGDLALSRHNSDGAVALVADFSAPTGGYHLRYAGNRGASLSRDDQLVQVSLVRRNGAPALAGSYLVDMLHSSADFTVNEHLVENGLQQISVGWHSGVGTR